MQATDFLGVWRFHRDIQDNTLLGAGIGQGEARFVLAGDTITYDETSEIAFAASPPLKGTRRYLWKPDACGVEIKFADGRPFHRLGLGSATATATHWCDPDQYDVVYDFSRWPNWTSRWHVKGPRKDYVMRTSYRRAK